MSRLAALAAVLAAAPASARPEIVSVAIGPTYVWFDGDAASSARGLELELHGPRIGVLQWSGRSVVASSNVTYRASTRPVHSMFLGLSGGVTYWAPPSRLARPWLGVAATFQGFHSDPQVFGGADKGEQILVGVGPSLAAGLDFPTPWVGVRVSTLTSWLPKPLAERRMAGTSIALGLQVHSRVP